jgi:hypothetical protein
MKLTAGWHLEKASFMISSNPSKNKNCGSNILPQPFFCKAIKPPCPWRARKEGNTIPVGLLACVSDDGLSAFSA